MGSSLIPLSMLREYVGVVSFHCAEAVAQCLEHEPDRVVGGVLHLLVWQLTPSEVLVELV